MLHTPLRTYRLPRKYEEVAVVCRLNEDNPYADADTILSSLQGEAVDMRCWSRLTTETRALCEHIRGEDYAPSSSFRLCSQDNESNASVAFCKATLRRTFHFIDDFCEAFPDKDSVVLPFDDEKVVAAITGLVRGRVWLADCLDCLRYLNPKSNTYYFRYLVRGTPLADLIALSEQLTTEERMWMLEARGWLLPLPMRGLSWDILGCVVEAQEDRKTAKLIFKNCPMYLLQFVTAYTVADTSALIQIKKLLLAESFYQEPDTLVQIAGERLNPAFSSLLSDPETTWVQIGRLLAMLGLRAKELENLDVDVRHPCERMIEDRVWDLRLLKKEEVIENIVLSKPGALSKERLKALIKTRRNDLGRGD